MNIQTTFAHNMKELRTKHGLTQEKLSEKCHLHRTYIGGIEQERINVSLKNIAKIAEALEVNPAYFFMKIDPDTHDTHESASHDTRGSASHDTHGSASHDNISHANASHKSISHKSTSHDNASPTNTKDNNSKSHASDTTKNTAQSQSVRATVPLPPSDHNAEETSYFLCTQTGTDMSLHPIEVENVDVALQILTALIEQGCSSEDLAQHYQDTKSSLLKYFYYEDESDQSST